ncbi:MAG TPA: polyprenyl synthetase family protein [Kofleriaceae bacterium]|nr:polyprenyl synthetase family protein [Kofleriaceae bacterium]
MAGDSRIIMHLERDPAPLLSHHLERIERCRRRLVSRLCNAPSGPALGEYLGRGKMLRAALVFLSCGAVGGDPEGAWMAAEAIEMLHGASLFHDDLIDEANERRGLPALHRRVGQSAALVLGDYLLVRAFDTLSEAHGRYPTDRVLDAVRTLSYLAQECCRGQLEELELSDQPVSEETYFSIIRGKTAAPFMAASVLGALLGGGTAEEIEQLRRYGLSLGIAFQIYDDLLDVAGDEGALGKPVGNSLAHGRPMLPLIYLRQVRASEAGLRQIQRSGGSIAHIKGLLETHGVLDRVRATQETFIDAAIAAVAGLAPSTDVEILRALPGQATAWWAPPSGPSTTSLARDVAAPRPARGLGG